MTYQYSYLLMGVVFLIIWIILFLWRKDTRKEMLVMSLIFAFAGPLADILYTQDWWYPQTLTNTKIGLEAILVAFMIGGITSVIYEDIFKKKIRVRKLDKKEKERMGINLFFLMIILAISFLGTFYLLGFNSLLSTITAFIIPTVIIYIKRSDLIIDSLATGFLLVIVAILVYTCVEILTPGWVQTFWYFKNVPEVIIFNVPIDDVIWYFLGGAFIGPLYEFWQDGRLRKLKK